MSEEEFQEEKSTVEEHFSKNKSVKRFLKKSAIAHNQWAEGQLLTDEQFKNGLKSAKIVSQ